MWLCTNISVYIPHKFNLRSFTVSNVYQIVYSYTPLLILMHDVIILTQNEAMGARSPSLAVVAPIASFWGSIVTYLMHREAYEIFARQFDCVRLHLCKFETMEWLKTKDFAFKGVWNIGKSLFGSVVSYLAFKGVWNIGKSLLAQWFLTLPFSPVDPGSYPTSDL